MLAGVKHPERFGVCVDTCHIFAAGYDLRSKAAYEATVNKFKKVVGLKQIKCFHLNDSKFKLGLKKDRHEHIGKGFIGKTGFACLMNDERFEKVPKVIETPEDEGGYDRDLKYLRKL